MRRQSAAVLPRLAMTALGVGLLSACATDHPPASTEPPPRPPAAAETATTDAPWVHPPSGMIFPANLAGFRREGVGQPSPGHNDTAVSYTLPDNGTPMSVTVYLTPTPPLPTVGLSPDAVAAARARACRQEFAASLRDVTELHPARRVGEHDVALSRNGRLRPGRLAVFAYPASFAGRRQMVRTELADFCFAGDGWSLQYRFTYPQGADSEPGVAAFLQALDWTGRLAN